MAKFVAGAGAVDGIDFREVDLDEFVFGASEVTPTVITLGNPPTDFRQLRGNFSVNKQGDVTGGTIHEIEAVENSEQVYEIVGTAVSIQTLAIAWFNDNPNQFLSAVFKSNDQLTGSATDDYLIGYAGNDTIEGLAGNDSLIGGGGNDSLKGGLGNDVYFIDSAKDVIDESDDLSGRDVIRSSLTIDLSKYAGVEEVELGGKAAINAFGTDGVDNKLTGNSAANKLDGRGGADTMEGGAGSDIYLADSADDQTNENPGSGIDTVIATGGIEGFTLGANVENLTVAFNVVSGFEGTGNDLANKFTGSKSDESFNGLGGNDILFGNDGNDGLVGGAGADTLNGGKGLDSYFVDNIGDKVVEAGPAGEFDQVFSTVAYALGANLEGLFLSGSDNIDGTGNALNNQMEGNFGDNVVNGLAGNDTLEVGPGKDTLIGGLGSDEFRFTDKNLDGLDVIIDFDGLPGSDKFNVSSLVGLLAAGTEADFIQTVVENGSTIVRLDLDGTGGTKDFVNAAVLQGVSTDLGGLLANGSIADAGTPAVAPLDGTPGADNKSGTMASDLIRGLGASDTLVGNAGFDTLNGGAGADSLIGGSESDTYVVDNAADKIDESGGGTDDRIIASVAIDLSKAAYAEIEHVTLSGIAALSAIGNGGANMLIGNTAANLLDGAVGDDTMIGGLGNDIYIVDSAGDLVEELVKAGTDLVKISTTYSLPNNVENLTLTGLDEIDGDGNALNNRIVGNGNTNTLEGLEGNDTLIGNGARDILDGGTGADSLVGGKGFDEYIIDSAKDKINEAGPAGETDTVVSQVSYALGANLEELWLTGDSTINGTGNGLRNWLQGNDKANTLSGLGGNDSLDGLGGADRLLGGIGNDTITAYEDVDTLTGGVGSDWFRFVVNSLDGLDVITDFNGLQSGDKIDVIDMLIGFDPGVSDINDYLSTSTTNGNTTILVDVDGTDPGVGFVSLCVLQGVATNLDALVANGSIVGLGP
jgi:Ca2+-binding RTX toxin-like protein